MATTAAADLDEAVARILGRAMGVRLPFGEGGQGRAPWMWGAAWLIVYGIVWLLLALEAIPPGTSQPRLVSLLAWGGLYFGAISFFAQAATDRICETLREDVLPHAHDPFKAAVAATLRRRFGPVSLVLVPLLVALASLAAAALALADEIGCRSPLWRAPTSPKCRSGRSPI